MKVVTVNTACDLSFLVLEESFNFVMVDEVGETVEKEAVITRTRGRPRKRTRQTPGQCWEGYF